MAGESIFEITLRAKAWDEARERELPHGFRCASRAKCSGRRCRFAGNQMKKAWIGLQRRDELKRAETTTLDTCVISMIFQHTACQTYGPIRWVRTSSEQTRSTLTNGTDRGSAMYPDDYRS